MRIKKNRSRFKKTKDLNNSEANNSQKAMRHIFIKNNKWRMEMKKMSLKKDKNKVKRKKMVNLKDNTNRI